MTKKATADAIDAALDGQKNLGGRPRKLALTDALLNQIEGLGRILATTRECAAVLNVAETTYLRFKAEHPEVSERYEIGRGQTHASLRRKQVELALKGNTTMLIWLGKNELGQADKQELTGANGGPIEHRVDDARDSLKRKLSRFLAKPD